MCWKFLPIFADVRHNMHDVATFPEILKRLLLFISSMNQLSGSTTKILGLECGSDVMIYRLKEKSSISGSPKSFVPFYQQHESVIGVYNEGNRP
jgi:hypothetical protein